MSKENKTFSVLKIGSFLVLILVVIFGLVYGQSLVDQADTAVIQGSINIQPVKPLANDSNKIQPGTPVKIFVTIENTGQNPSPVGEVYVRYALTKPLDKQPNSVIFQTEKVPVKAIEPGKQAEIEFTSLHQLPSLNDFIRYDWPMREYQAVFVTDNQESIISNLAITFSAYYYPALKHEIPTRLPTHRKGS